MTTIAADIANMVDMLPEEEQKFAQEFVRKLVLAWDPDFTLESGRISHLR